MIDERRSAWPEPHRLDRPEYDIVRGDCLGFDGAAIERDHGGGEHRRARLQRDPFALRKTLMQMYAASAGEQIGKLFFAGGKRIDAEHAVLREHRR